MPAWWPFRHVPLEAVQWLPAWLNGGPAAEKTRILRLVDQLQRLQRLKESVRDIPLAERSSAFRRELLQVQAAINELSRRYHGYPGFALDEPNGDKLAETFQPMHGTFGFEEWEAFNLVRRLVSAGAFDRLCQCRCRRWFIKIGRKEHCSDRCRRAEYEGSQSGRRRKEEWYDRTFPKGKNRRTEMRRRREQTS